MKPFRWDIFCKVVDNFGDIGVCWRFAKQLATETNETIRLWVDDLPTMQKLVNTVQLDLPSQLIEGIEVQQWDDANIDACTVFSDIVIEAFACDIPLSYISKTYQANPHFCWINLEYLSAESWVEDCHGMTSIHPQLGITKYFIFPGFTDKTAGLFREHDLISKRDQYLSSINRANEIERAKKPIYISLFAYENPSLPVLLDTLMNYSQPIHLYVTDSKILPDVKSWLHSHINPPSIIETSRHFKMDKLVIECLPFMSQDEYDELLWRCDLNFIRGEDSFLRAQWAGKPFIWHIYQQEENAHLDKLSAFLDRYLNAWPTQLAANFRALSYQWNTDLKESDLLTNLLNSLPEHEDLAISWQKTLEKQQPIAKQLAQFCKSRLEL
ncbi:elongation factor P maturation arginine rhamnosyltransferase EarP [Leeia sp. TBRC 13508]|uniref:Protein-arginine rhamnosyltransferase n=1 Tax=Leeia speluncae TaxID=2884804 RepID=A0ABS8D991_9NEIS|nr:elongation factor P maturation arginine rhamnosyltransferase EarP [Leeia speluncae]MCB6184173.1 elongation factor P maturation arginine rhamnosyltransferase EarP [Leeia speluncae]